MEYTSLPHSSVEGNLEEETVQNEEKLDVFRVTLGPKAIKFLFIFSITNLIFTCLVLALVGLDRLTYVKMGNAISSTRQYSRHLELQSLSHKYDSIWAELTLNWTDGALIWT